MTRISWLSFSSAQCSTLNTSKIAKPGRSSFNSADSRLELTYRFVSINSGEGQDLPANKCLIRHAVRLGLSSRLINATFTGIGIRKPSQGQPRARDRARSIAAQLLPPLGTAEKKPLA